MRAIFRGVLLLALVFSIGVALGSRVGFDLPFGQDTTSPSTAQTPASQTSTPTLVDATDANNDTNTAIQQVIQKSNDEQVQAIAAKTPAAMADTLTSDHYQEMVRVNQDLLDNGVASIQLVKLEWGAINATGTNATATTFETWTTTYADGTTDQSRDQNEYRLVLDSGAWKIAGDDHPTGDAGGPGAGTAPSASSPPPQRPVPANPDSRNTSHNWSGYAASGGNFTAVSGTWTVPQFSAQSSFGIDAAWVGIGGVRSRDLIQAGTQQTVSGNGRTQYEAWIELLPRTSRPVPLSVHAGDSVTVSITEDSTDSWTIAFSNNTTGQTYNQSVQYTSSHSSAEWVEEAPSGGRGGILPLDNFGTVQFSSGSAIKDGQTVSIAGAGARAITMIGAGDQALAVPSALSDDGSSFNVARTDAPAQTSATRGNGRRRAN